MLDCGCIILILVYSVLIVRYILLIFSSLMRILILKFIQISYGLIIRVIVLLEIDEFLLKLFYLNFVVFILNALK